MGIKVRCWTCYTCTYWSINETDWSSEQPSIDFQTTKTTLFISWWWSPSFDLARNTKSQPSILTSRTCMENNQTFAFTRGYFWGIRPIIRKPHIICAVTLVNPCFIHVHDIIPCFPKRFDLSQIITPIIDNRHLVVQNSSIIPFFL